MGIRIVCVAALAVVSGFVLLSPLPQPPAQAQVAPPAAPPPSRVPLPPPMFSPWYVESLRDILDLEASDVMRLEQQLAANPNDFPARLKLMAYQHRADRAALPEDRAKRLQHVLWLVEHHPESELLHSPVSRFAPAELNTEERTKAIALWDTATKRNPRAAAVQWNAATFFESLDPALYMHYLEVTAAADPNHPFALRPLAHLYALSIVDNGPLAVSSVAALEASKNVWVLGNAAYMLQSQYNRALQMGVSNSRIAQLAERYFNRAKAIDPNLDRNAILPEIDLESIARAQQSNAIQQTNAKIRRFVVDAFPELPAAIAQVLRARNCLVPQPDGDSSPRNVIRGEFFAKGESGWAVLCSVNEATELLVFRNDRDARPQTVTASGELNHVQGLGGGRAGYSRQITPVDRSFILRHYRAYGGPPPPPIDHHGIDDAFLGKASTTWYFHQGTWLQLQGAD